MTTPESHQSRIAAVVNLLSVRLYVCQRGCSYSAGIVHYDLDTGRRWVGA